MCFPPSSGAGLELGAEPAFSLAPIDLGAAIPRGGGCVIDAAIGGDVALDGAALRGRFCLWLGPMPPKAGTVFLSRRCGLQPYATAARTGLLFLW